MNSIFWNTIKCKFTTVTIIQWESMGCYFHGTVARLRNIAHERHRLHLTHICIVFSKITKWQRFTFFARLFFFFAGWLVVAVVMLALFFICSFSLLNFVFISAFVLYQTWWCIIWWWGSSTKRNCLRFTGLEHWRANMRSFFLLPLTDTHLECCRLKSIRFSFWMIEK